MLPFELQARLWSGRIALPRPDSTRETPWLQYAPFGAAGTIITARKICFGEEVLHGKLCGISVFIYLFFFFYPSADGEK